ncbi:chloramphenicol acetyltransferase, partial [bacterium]|nr:chloramphenicol acetyltransferase [bacterium]
MKQLIDIQKWNRKEHFEFFNTFEDPFFGLVTDIPCRPAYEYAKAGNISFYKFYLHAVLKAL